MPIVIGLLLYPLLLIWRGYAVSILWRWFVSPALGSPEISIAYAIGFCVLFELVKIKPIKKDTKPVTWELVSYGIVNLTLTPAFALLVGYCVRELAL